MMSRSIEEWHRATRKLIDDAKKSPDREAIQHMIQEWQEALDTMEAACPGIRDRYEKRKEIQDTFTTEQIDHICYMIGEWYIEWKERIVVDLKQGTHRLGFAKEQLKTMICGD